MQKSVFEFQDYKRYITALIESQPKRGRGLRSQLAQAIGCQVAYISQILNGHLHLSVEQAVRVNKFFAHSKDEGNFFLLLVQHARAGDADTRAHFQELLEAELAKRLVLSRRLGLAQGIREEDQVTYYSAWFYSAIHILVTIPAFQTRAAIAAKLGLSKESISEALDFLARTGLVLQQGDRFIPGPSQFHLAQSSKLAARSHTNWRVRVLGALDAPKDTDVHYTGVYSLSTADALKLKALVLKQIEEVIAVVKPSKEEQLGIFCVDFFTP
jgi:plasmid maintenance system antidote protein VapI